MTGSTNPGLIQPQQDLTLSLDVNLFINEGLKLNQSIFSPLFKYIQRNMTNPAIQSVQSVQLTPVWEYVVRMKQFPKHVDMVTIFYEISDRLCDPEWEVRQHALRVLTDVLPTLSIEFIDDIVSLVLPNLIENLGNSAPAVRKGSLDAVRIYLLHTPRRDELTKKILEGGLNRADVLDNYQTNIVRGIILSAPLLLFPSRSSVRPSYEVVRETTQALAMRLVQVTHQESALRSLIKIREIIGEKEFYSYLQQIDDSMQHNFELLCDIYKNQNSVPILKKKYVQLKSNDTDFPDKKYQNESVNDLTKAVVPINKNWENKNSVATNISEKNGDSTKTMVFGISSARIVLETEIKFDEETAITMTILEQKKEIKETPTDVFENEVNKEKNEIETLPMIETAHLTVSSDKRRKTSRRVHFGGEVVKLRTPDSEDAESLILETQQQSECTKIPLPVSPATRMPSKRRVRSSLQSVNSQTRFSGQRRSVSSSPKRELYTHDANLSPKKSILAKNSENTELQTRIFQIQDTESNSHLFQRDSVISIFSPKIIPKDIIQHNSESSFHSYKESGINYCLQVEKNVVQRNKMHQSSNLLGDICGIEDKQTKDNFNYVFGDKSGMEFKKIQKDHDNLMRSRYRSKSALEKVTKFDWRDKQNIYNNWREQRRVQSAKSPGFKVFPRQERNYIFMELSSPLKDLSRRASLEDNLVTTDYKNEAIDNNQDTVEINEIDIKNSTTAFNEQLKTEEKENLKFDSNKELENLKTVNKMKSEHELSNGIQQDLINTDIKKVALDIKDRSSDSSSDGEWKTTDLSWEELGLVDDEVLNDFHNKDDWRARVRGLEHIAAALRTPSALAILEPRLGSLLHALLGGERSCRVAAAGLAVAKVVITGVSEETLKNRLSLIAWGLARQGGPNAAHLARLTMLRTSPGLFLEKLLQPQCIDAKNAKMRENTLQLLIFSLIIFPSSEFKVKSAIDKIVAMIDDPRKRVRHSALDTLAVLSQIYDSEDILEASERFTKDKQDGQLIRAAIKIRISRKLLPTVSMDGLIVYGLQISSNCQYSGADVDWIIAGSGSVSPGTGRTRRQLIAMTKIEDSMFKQNCVGKKPKSKSANEYSSTSETIKDILDKNERTSSWKLLPHSNQNDRQSEEIKAKKLDRTSKSADLSKNLQIYNEEILQKNNFQKSSLPSKCIERKSEFEVSKIKFQRSKQIAEHTSQANVSCRTPELPQESRIPIYTGPSFLNSEMNDEKNTKNRRDTVSMPCWKCHHDQCNTSNINSEQRRKLHYKISPSFYNYAYSFPQYTKSFEAPDSKLKVKFTEITKNISVPIFKGNNQRSFSYEKLNIDFDAVIRERNSTEDIRNISHYKCLSNFTETFESIYQRKHRLRKEKKIKMIKTASRSLIYGYAIGDYIVKQNSLDKTNENIMNIQILNRNLQKNRVFSFSFDKCTFKELSKTQNKETLVDQKTNCNTEKILTNPTLTSNEQIPSSGHDVNKVKSNSGNALCSNQSTTSSRKVKSHENLPIDTEGDKSNDIFDRNSQTTSFCLRSNDKAFDVICTKTNPSRCNTPEFVSIHTDVEEELEVTNSISPTKLSVESSPDDGSDVVDRTTREFATPDSSRSHSTSCNEQNCKDTNSGCSTSPKSLSSRRFVNEDQTSKDSDSDETSPRPIAFDGSDDTDEIDDIDIKPQTSMDMSIKTCKGLTLKTKRQMNSNRTKSLSSNRYYEKHVEKSKLMQQCFEQLESNDWEVTLKGLRTLTEIAKNEPEQLDSCTPGFLARILGKHIKNLRSQVARVACTATSQVFSAHIRGIDQDLDEIAGPLLHRTADTNKFLRNDCNAALDSMIEHFPSHRTIMTIVNRGGSHQNTIVHATTARLLFLTVTKIGPEHVINLSRDVKDKLFAATAKLLTDGNVQARKYAKETFRLLSRCEGFRKTLTDAVPENTLRFIDKTLKSL